MADPSSLSEDITTDSNLKPFDRANDASPIKLSDATRDDKQLSTMSLSRRTDQADVLSALNAGDITPTAQITASQSPRGHPATIEDDIVLEPEVVVSPIKEHRRRPVQLAGHDYSNVSFDNARVHVGDVYYQNYQAPPRSSLRHEGFNFDMGTSFGREQQFSAFESAYESREAYTSKKRPVLAMLMAHQEPYKKYTPVTDLEVRSCLEQIARLFTDLDEFFAAMFVHVVLSSDASKLSKELAQIRREITSRQPTDTSQGDSQGNVYLGDLGHYCEALLRRNRQTEHKSDATTSLPEFRPTHSDKQSWIEYLEDGFEIPYWKLMLNTFSTSRLRKSTLGGKVIATALISMRSDVVELRRTLQKVLDGVSEPENIEGILSVIDKRINILQGFTDRVALDKRSRDRRFETDVKKSDNTEANAGPGTGNQPSTSDPLLLVTLVLLTLIAAIVPFTLGSKASNETGTTSDADFWYNISSSIFTIMANFVMIIQLTEGSRFSNRYMHVWIWFFLGVVCAIISVAIYPFCNTAWSSLLSFFATIAGFGAMLSVAMIVASPRSGESVAKKKVE